MAAVLTALPTFAGFPFLRGELAPFFFRQALWRPAADILLDVSGVAADQPREPGEVLATLRTQAFEHLSWFIRH